MSSISAIASQSNPVMSTNLSPSTKQAPVKDGDGDHGVEASAKVAAPVAPSVGTTPAPGQPGAIINTTA